MGQETSVVSSMALVYFPMLILILALPIVYLLSRTRILKSENEKQRVAFKSAQEAEEKQRERIAASLHDEVIPLLSVIVQNFEINIRDFGTDKFSIENLKEDKQVAIQSIQSVKDAALELIPKELLKFGFVTALNSFLKKLQFSMTATLENNTLFQKELPFTKPEELSIYRLCLELINNLRKHDHIERLTVKLESVDKMLLIKFLHDGQGITNAEIGICEKTSNGLGLKSIHSRLITLNASINYVQSEAGSAIIVKIPIKQ